MNKCFEIFTRKINLGLILVKLQPIFKLSSSRRKIIIILSRKKTACFFHGKYNGKYKDFFHGNCMSVFAL